MGLITHSFWHIGMGGDKIMNSKDFLRILSNGKGISGYEYLISNFAGEAGKKAGEFYTPSEVSTLLAKLVDPQSGDRICDPACGSGSLLLKFSGKNNVSLLSTVVGRYCS